MHWRFKGGLLLTSALAATALVAATARSATDMSRAVRATAPSFCAPCDDLQATPAPADPASPTTRTEIETAAHACARR